MRNIAIFQRDLGIGGIQRSLINLITNTDLSYYRIDLYLFVPKGSVDMAERENLRIYYLKPMPYLNRVVPFNIIKRNYYYDFPDTEYDLAIDYNSYSNECALCALTVNAKKRVMWIHNDLRVELSQTFKYKVLYHAFKAKYKLYDEFVAVSGGIIEPFRSITHQYFKPIRIIPNAINTAELFRMSEAPVDFSPDPQTTNFIFVGRYTRQKGIDLMIDYFADALTKRTDIHLYMIGAGPEESAIEHKINNLKLDAYITRLPETDNPFPFMTKCDALILTSRHEGQGIVLQEAKALGLDLIFPTRLEKYNPIAKGTDDIVGAILKERPHEKNRDSLDTYNLRIKNELYGLFDNA